MKNKQEYSQRKLTSTKKHKTSKFKVGDQVLLKEDEQETNLNQDITTNFIML